MQKKQETKMWIKDFAKKCFKKIWQKRVSPTSFVCQKENICQQKNFPKVSRLLLKITKITTEHQKWPKMGQNSIFFFPKGKKILGQRLKNQAHIAGRIF